MIEPDFTDWEKPSWDDFMMSLALVVAMRSIDYNTKHGCVISDSQHRIISMGYNGPVRGGFDENIPRTRPEKYYHMEHSERNAIFNARRDLEGSTFYITGYPCCDCTRAMIQCGAKHIVYGQVGCKLVTEETRKHVDIMLTGQDIRFENYSNPPIEVLTKALAYYMAKTGIDSLYRAHKVGGDNVISVEGKLS
tara:strand:- start:455 stop:1033 length:579 start_codon:yes stop_codon:yes gene_type:complete